MKTFASLFTGGGLADIGAMMAGYELLWGIEYDPAISAVANENLPHRDKVYPASVVGFDWDAVERPDHLHMSPPCQDFSVAKKHKSKAEFIKALDFAMELARACVEAIEALLPDTVTLENVEQYRKPIVIDEKVYNPFNCIVDYLWGLGYWVNSDVLNAADFGVPQTRRRLFLRAVRGGFPGPLPPPVRPWKGWYEAIKDLIPTLPETEFAPWQLARLPGELRETCFVEGTNTIREATVRRSHEPRTSVIASEMRRPISTPKAFLIESKNANQQYGDGMRDADEPHTTVVTDCTPSHQPKVLMVDGIANSNGKTMTTVNGIAPSFTVKASSGKQASRASTPSGRVVRMTPRALARFQTVPDWYVLPEKKALACKIIGNGVPCLMMQRILESIRP